MSADLLPFPTRHSGPRGEVYVFARSPGDFVVDHLSEGGGSAGIVASGFSTYAEAYQAARLIASRLNARLFPPEDGGSAA